MDMFRVRPLKATVTTYLLLVSGLNMEQLSVCGMWSYCTTNFDWVKSGSSTQTGPASGGCHFGFPSKTICKATLKQLTLKKPFSPSCQDGQYRDVFVSCSSVPAGAVVVLSGGTFQHIHIHEGRSQHGQSPLINYLQSWKLSGGGWKTVVLLGKFRV